ncbi:MAG: RNA polymerase sigma factor [Acidimicrobiales bacterium]
MSDDSLERDGYCVLAQAREQGPEAVDALIRHLLPQLLRFASAIRADDPEAMVNEAFLRLQGRGDLVTFPTLQAMRSYLCRSIRNQLIDQARQNKTKPNHVELPEQLPSRLPSFESLVDDTEHIEQLLGRLSPAQRRVIELRFLEELSIEETSERTGKPVGTVKALQHRGIRQLRLIALGVAVAVVGLAVIFAVRQLHLTDVQPISTDPEPPAELDGQPVVDEQTRVLSGTPFFPVQETAETDSTMVSADSAGGSADLSITQDSTVGPATATTSTAAISELPLPGESTVTTATPTVPATEAAIVLQSTTTTATPLLPTPSAGPATTQQRTIPACTHTFTGLGSGLTEGSSGVYWVNANTTASVDRQVTVFLRSISAGQAPAGVDGATQDIMWGGSYSVGARDGFGRWIETGRVSNRVPNSSDPADGDRPMVGPIDQSWDYSASVDGQRVNGSSITVTIPAGQYDSNPIEITAWREQLTVDLRTGATDGFEEPRESFMFETAETRRLRPEGAICDAIVYITDNPQTIFVGGR